MSGLDLNKVRSDIADLKNKKQTLMLSLQRDIDGIRKQIMDSFRTVGEKAYTLSKSGTDSMATLGDDFSAITQYLANIAEREQKSHDVSARYDDEIEMMEKLIPDGPEQNAQAFCESCGERYTPGTDMFCMSCGKKL